MAWVKLSGYENGMVDDDEPRPLTPEEIIYITD